MSDAACIVLTDPMLFREVIAWAAGWPGIIASKILPMPALDWHHPPTSATDALYQVADARTLEIARSARWWNAHGELVGFNLTDMDLALRSGNATAMRFVFTENKPSVVTYDMFYHYWSLAVTHCQGHCDVLEVVNTFVSPRQKTTTFVFSGDYLFSIQHASVARWFVEQYGPACLPKTLIETALARGKWGLFYYLRKIPSQVMVSQQDLSHHRLCKAIENCDSSRARRHANRLVNLTTKTNDIELIEQVLIDWSSVCSPSVVHDATKVLGRLASRNQRHLMQLPGREYVTNALGETCIIS